MYRRATIAGICAVFLAGCTDIPPVSTSTISTSPASAQAFSQAQRALRVCAALPDSKRMFDGFEALGYREAGGPDVSSVTKLPGGGRSVVVPLVYHNDGQLIVQAAEGYCFVGLRGMTPEQSYRLAQMLVRKYDLATNAELGQGVSSHVVEAWQAKTRPSSRILVAAHKTWPWDRGHWPKDQKGAAVTLYHRGVLQ